MRRALILLLALCAAVPGYAKDKDKDKPAPPQAASPAEVIDEPAQYRHCISLARQKPTDGWEEALAWSSMGGGEPARHCAAIALIGLGQFEEAANRLETLAGQSRANAKTRAGMLDQAGQSWLLAERPERANAALTTALQLMPDAPDLLVDRAQSLAAAKNYREALADLDRALAVAPDRADALTFRATAKRFLDDQAGAAADAAKALAVDPLYQDAWLEDGIIKRLRGDDNGARKSWLKVLELAPASTAADSARHNIEVLDVKDH
ncbi:MAG TPA: hypothetical protein HPQ04_13890 [Rhodospirillaceae bacterium]|nr:hypothetical protein [Rhodospirillaceae bacterium]